LRWVATDKQVSIEKNAEGDSSVADWQSGKDPWLAVNFSMFFPGLGQIYGGRVVRGGIWFGVAVIVLAIALWSIFAADGNTVQGLIYLGVALGVYCFNLLDALLCIHRDNPGLILEKIPRTHKNPWFAVFVSRVIPGLGHLYLNQSVLGLILLAMSLVLYRLDDLFKPLLIITPLLTAIAVYHSYLIFPRRHLVTHRQLIAIMAGVIFLGGLVLNFLPQFLGQHLEMFEIPSESMMPTLQVGDRVFVWHGLGDHFQRGNVVVFEPNQSLKMLDPQVSAFYIKRIVALEGEQVEIRKGKVWIDNQPLEENYLEVPPLYEMPPQTIPIGHYFLLGDNRNASFDSHIWGALPRRYVVGRAYKIYWPPARIQSLVLPNN
jgi:signal peptidase I